MVVLKKKDYPLKKRPLSVCYENSGEQTEPQDLSLKCDKEVAKIEPQALCTSPCKDDTLLQKPQITGLHRSSQDNIKVDTFPSEMRFDAEAPNKTSFCPENISPLGHPTFPMFPCYVEPTHNHKRYTQVIRTHNSTLDSKQQSEHNSFLPNSNLSVISRSTSNRETHLSSKVSHRRRDLLSQVVPTSPTNRRNGSEGKRARNEDTYIHPSSVITPMNTLGQPTCTLGQSISTTFKQSISGAVSPRIPMKSGDFLLEPSFGHQLNQNIIPPHNAKSSHNKILDEKVTSQSSAAPHRPWLSEGPNRMTLTNRYPDSRKIIPPQTSQNQSLPIGPRGLWGGMGPFSWSVPPILPNPQPPSSPSGHPPQLRECYSPGSESASSDGSNSSARNDSRYSCTDCSKSYSTYSGLSKHRQFHCTALGSKSFACKHCEKVYTSLGALKMHIRTHTLPCKCPLCGKAFSRPWLLQGHIRTHTGEKPFQCPQCDRCFADRSNLRAHLQTHADIKKYACNTCQKTFSRMSLLNKHTEAACPAIQRRSLQ